MVFLNYGRPKFVSTLLFLYCAEELVLNVCELNVQHEIELHNRYSDDLAK